MYLNSCQYHFPWDNNFVKPGHEMYLNEGSNDLLEETIEG